MSEHMTEEELQKAHEELIEKCNALQEPLANLIAGQDVRAVAMVLSRLTANAFAQVAHVGAASKQEQKAHLGGLMNTLFTQAVEYSQELPEKVDAPEPDIILSSRH